MSGFLLLPPDFVGRYRRMMWFGSRPFEPLCVIVLQHLERAIPEGLEKWRTHAGFVAIDGQKAHGGKLMGPPLKSAILEAWYRFPPPALSGLAEWQVPVLKVIVNTLSDAWSEFERSFSVPHLDWYPSFASCRPPVALPTANKACFIKSLTFSVQSLSPQPLAERMRRSFAPPEPVHASSSASRSTPAHLPLDAQSRAQLVASGKVAQSPSQALARLGLPAQSSPPSPPPGFPPSSPFGVLPPVPPTIPLNPYALAPLMFRAIADGLYSIVGNWLAGQRVTGAMGSGPVPTATSGVRNGNVMPGPHLRG
jgi:hypothetical protein